MNGHPALGDATPEALLAYQQKALRAIALDDVTVIEKSRRIGLTWGIAAETVLTASRARSAHGMDAFYVGYNLEMAREFIDACAMWARSFDVAASEVGEALFTEQGEDGKDRAIKAFRIAFASGFEIVALCSAPRSLRGKQGLVIVDEAAFHADLPELLKAAMALLMWGGKVVIVSTHDGVDNAFNQLVEDCRSGRKPYGLVRITFEDAVRDGLYRRICLVAGREWSDAAEREWVESIRAFYGEDAAEELDCIPKRSGGRWLPAALLTARARPVPVLRWTCDPEFTFRAEAERRDALDAFLAELRPLVDAIPSTATSYLGSDFARSGDLSVEWPLVEEGGVATTPFVVEMRGVPFTEQEAVIWWLVSHLPNLRGAALDARGNGQMIAERISQRAGSSAVEGVMLSEKWYREQTAPLKADLEDANLLIASDPDLVDDLRSVEIVRGIPRVPDKPRRTKGGQRHGDGAIGLMLASYARHVLCDGGPVDITVDGSSETHATIAGGDGMGGRLPGGWLL